jgi:dUTP pyrophosphatase
MALTLKFFKTFETGINDPKFGTEGAACFDLEYSPYGKKSYSGYNNQNSPFSRQFSADGSLTMMPGDRVLVPTGLIFEIPVGHSIRVHPRSGKALKEGLALINAEGIIDSDYFHECFVPLINHSDSPVKILPWDRIAQAELIKNLPYELKETKEQPKQTTSRNGGFGSTDKIK